MNIYALAFGARNKETSLYTVGAVQAVSQAEAVGLGVEKARENWPQDEGWEGHQCLACQIPDEWVVSMSDKVDCRT